MANSRDVGRRSATGLEVENDPRFTVSRRGFLKLASLGAAAGSLPLSFEGCDPGGNLDEPTLSVRVRRPDDLLVADLLFFNLIRPGGKQGVLQRLEPPKDAFIALRMQPQHILERAIPEMCPAPQLPVDSFLSGPSRVVFVVPDSLQELPFELDALLELLRGFELRVVTAASQGPAVDVGLLPGNITVGQAIKPAGDLDDQVRSSTEPPPRRAETDQAIAATQSRFGDATQITREVLTPQDPGPGPVPPVSVADAFEVAPIPSPPAPEKPGDAFTSLELPTRLILSPNHSGRFDHAAGPVQSDSTGHVELWHSRLSGSSTARRVRAVWTRDWDELNDEIATLDFNASLNEDSRSQIVRQSSDAELLSPQAPTPIETDALFLTALGGYLDARGDFPLRDDLNLNLTHWSHRATLGRDHFVKVALEGLLFPWGHRATLVVISERKIEDSPQTAFLWQRYFLIIKEPSRNYFNGFDDSTAGPFLRQLPLQNVTFTQLVTPSLDAPGGGPDSCDGSPVDLNTPFVPEVDGKTFRFPFEATDRQGGTVRAETAAVWLPLINNLEPLASLNDLFEQPDGTGGSNRAVQLMGQRLGMVAGEGDGVSHEAHELHFRGGDIEGAPSNLGYGVPWLPFVQNAHICVEAARTMQGGDGRVEVTFYNDYVDSGFSGNEGEVFLQLAEALDLGFSDNTDKSGGFVSPDMPITGLSRSRGAVPGDIGKFAAGNVSNPGDMFGSLLPKLFGVIPLTDILDLGNLDDAPSLVADTADAVRAFLSDLGRLESAAQQAASDLQSKAEAVPNEMQDVLNSIGGVIDAITTPPMNLDLTDPDSIDGFIENLQMALMNFGAEVSDLEQALLGLPALGPNVRRNAREVASRVRRALEDVNRVISLIERVVDVYRNIQLAQTGTIRLEFKPPIKGDPQGIFEPNGGLVLGAEIRSKAVDGRPAGADIFCGLENFRINLIGASDPVFIIDFERLQFVVRAGSKPDVDVVLDNIGFGGPLSFIEKIKSLIPLDGFSDPPAVEVGLDGLRASFSLPLPSISVGVLSLENISISAGFRIPFLGDAITIHFGFCSRENPFRLTVSMLGGGGFVGLELAPGQGGLRLLEVSLEFGAALSVDFGVASGGVSIMAGVYFAIESDDVLLNGYLRIRGELCVLGLIGASIELAMELSYQSSTGKVIGRASLMIEVTILAFSIGVTLEVERKFKGSNGDPTFAQVMSPLPAPASPADDSDQAGTPWAQYVNAFA